MSHQVRTTGSPPEELTIHSFISSHNQLSSNSKTLLGGGDLHVNFTEGRSLSPATKEAAEETLVNPSPYDTQ